MLHPRLGNGDDSAMHIPDGFVSGPVNVAGAVVAAGTLAVSTWRALREAQDQPQTVPLLATTGAFVFAAQMLNFPIGGGTSGHFLGAAAVTALLGPWRACLVMTLVVTLQALGVQRWWFDGAGHQCLQHGRDRVFWQLRCHAHAAGASSRRAGPAIWWRRALAGWASVLLAAAACAVELALSGTSPLFLVLPAMLGTHAVIGVGEALITTARPVRRRSHRGPILCRRGQPWGAAAMRQPARARCGSWPVRDCSWRSRWRRWPVRLRPVSRTDWRKLPRRRDSASLAEGPPVWHNAPLPDYAVPGVEAEGVSTGLAGILGTLAVFLLGFGVVKLLGRRGVKREN